MCGGPSLCRFGEWNLKDVDFLNQVQLITAKPVVYLVNLPEKMYIKKKSKWLPKVFPVFQTASACVQNAGYFLLCSFDTVAGMPTLHDHLATLKRWR